MTFERRLNEALEAGGPEPARPERYPLTTPDGGRLVRVTRQEVTTSYSGYPQSHPYKYRGQLGYAYPGRYPNSIRVGIGGSWVDMSPEDVQEVTEAEREELIAGDERLAAGAQAYRERLAADPGLRAGQRASWARLSGHPGQL